MFRWSIFSESSYNIRVTMILISLVVKSLASVLEYGITKWQSSKIFVISKLFTCELSVQYFRRWSARLKGNDLYFSRIYPYDFSDDLTLKLKWFIIRVTILSLFDIWRSGKVSLKLIINHSDWKSTFFLSFKDDTEFLFWWIRNDREKSYGIFRRIIISTKLSFVWDSW